MRKQETEGESSIPIRNPRSSIPRYGTVSMQLFEIGQESTSIPDFMWNLGSSVCSHFVISTAFAVCSFVAVLMCYFGLVYINQCPAKKEIPIYLLVGGGVSLLQISLIMMRHRKERQEELGEDTDLAGIGLHTTLQDVSYSNNSSKITEGIVWAFLFIWFCIGNVWVFAVFRPPEKQHERSETPTDWCRGMVYNFALFQIGLTHIVIFILVLTVVICACCATKFLRNNNPHERSNCY